jgi:lipopolysaccharide export system ATP-binding protein
MSVQFDAHFEGRDPSLPLAVASVLRCTMDDGMATFEALTLAYREDYLSLHQQSGLGDMGQQAGTLSVDEVRRHLQQSVLPRLAMDGVMDALPDSLSDDTPLRLTGVLGRSIVDDPAAAREALFQIALENIHKAESAGLATAPGRNGASELSARGLTKVYRKRAVVDDVDLSLRQGEIVGLLGPNGAGKTTSFYMIVGLIRPDGGQVSIDGDNLSSLPMYKRARLGIGYLSQEPSVFRKLTVEDNVMAILQTLKLKPSERQERLETLLDELSIKHLRKVPAYKLSGGERRRLEITRALVTEPRFMLLDEPFAGVDPIAVHDIQMIVAGLRRRGIGVLITDHNVEQTLDIVDRAYIMFEGKVQVSGTVRELVFNERVADLYLGPTLTARLRERLEGAA